MSLRLPWTDVSDTAPHNKRIEVLQLTRQNRRTEPRITTSLSLILIHSQQKWDRFLYFFETNRSHPWHPTHTDFMFQMSLTRFHSVSKFFKDHSFHLLNARDEIHNRNYAYNPYNHYNECNRLNKSQEESRVIPSPATPLCQCIMHSLFYTHPHSDDATCTIHTGTGPDRTGW